MDWKNKFRTNSSFNNFNKPDDIVAYQLEDKDGKPQIAPAMSFEVYLKECAEKGNEPQQYIALTREYCLHHKIKF